MRARQRLLLDIVIAAGLIAAYRPSWTGISLHEWISAAIIVPLAVHLVVNWDWAVRIARTFLDRLFHTSRANFVVDSGLLVSSVAVMASGVMVSPVPALFGATVAQPLVWSALHAWSANAIIALFAVHAALHWRWVVATVKRLATESPAAATARPGSSRRRRAPAAAHTAAASRDLTPSQRRRAVRLAAEKAAAKRRAAVGGVVAVSLALGSLLFASVAVAGPALSREIRGQLSAAATATPVAAPAPVPTAKSTTAAVPRPPAKKKAATPAAAPAAAPAPSKQYCPRTGCGAYTCHGATGASPGAWYRTHN